MRIYAIVLVIVIAILALSSCNRKSAGDAGGNLEPDQSKPAPGTPEAARARISAAMTWTVILCALGIGAAAVLVILGQRTIGIAAGAGSIATTVAALTISQHQRLISWLGLAFGVLVAGLLIYAAWVHKRALLQLVQTGEAGKSLLDGTSREQLYGGEMDKGIAGKIQTPATEALVKTARRTAASAGV